MRQNLTISSSSPLSPVPCSLFPAPRLFYLNALFDLELGGYPLESVRAGAREMGTLFSFCGTTRDRLLLDVQVPDDYWTYLDLCAIPHALPIGAKDNPADFLGIAWGWNQQSADRLNALGTRRRHPDLDAVKTVNNRAFCAAFNSATNTGVPGSRFCATINDVRLAVHTLNKEFPVVAKPAFGGSGSGFVVINALPDIDGCMRNHIEKLLDHGGSTIEPWCDRNYDLSSSCTVESDGSVSDLRHYRCFTNKRGAFYGVSLSGEPDPVIETYRDTLETTVTLACNALSGAGYYGPASFDSFVYQDRTDAGEKLAAIIEINGRFIMSTIAHALYSSVGCDRSCYFRFLGRKMHPMPETYDACRKILGNDWYDPVKRKGVVLLSPLRVSHGKTFLQPVRSAFFIVGCNKEEVLAMDDRLREGLTF